jgi:hypothetical protein
LGKYIAATVSPAGSHSFTIQLVSRLEALTAYESQWISPPQQMKWMLLAMHQLVFEKVAVAHPAICGCSGLAPQPIKQAVNSDLNRIFTLGTGKEMSARRSEYLKVSRVSPTSLLIGG